MNNPQHQSIISVRQKREESRSREERVILKKWVLSLDRKEETEVVVRTAADSRQWVPYPWSSNRERAITSRCSGSWNEKSRSLGWSGWWIMCLRYKILMQIHDSLESEKNNFILNPLSDREPVEIIENWSYVLILWSLCDGPAQENLVHAGVSGCSACSYQNIMNYNNQACLTPES